MNELYQYLSGNVPGGLGLYVLLVLLIFITLYSISKNNDLFTPKHFKRFFLWIWLVMTAGYLFWWMSNPPVGKMYRYTAIVQPSNADQDLRWLSEYLQEMVEEGISPFQDRNEVFLQQRWLENYNLPNEQSETSWNSLINRLPAFPYAYMMLERRGGKPTLILKRYDEPSNTPTAETVLDVDLNDPRPVLKSLQNLLGEPFTLREGVEQSDPTLRELTRVKTLFYRGDFKESRKLAAELFTRMPKNRDVAKWFHFNEVKRAAVQKAPQEATRTNPLDQKKLPWQQMLHKSRGELLRMVQENLKNDVNDDLLIAMAAESFMLDEFYSDAEELLEIGYGLNPMSLDILIRMSRLHVPRYRDLGFADETAILRQILEICPFEETILERFAERQIPRVNLETATGEELRDRLKTALTINPNSSRTWVLQGKFDNAIQNFEGALHAFAKADSLSTPEGVLKYNRGVALFKLERYDEAAEYFNEAIKIDDYLDAHLYLGAIYREQGDYEKALARFRYRVANKGGEEDVYVIEAMKGIRDCLDKLNIPIPTL